MSDWGPGALLPLAPAGVGTPWVEGLSSYVVRLAVAHLVPTRLFVAELFPRSFACSPRDAMLGRRGVWLNGMGTTARDVASALEGLTLRRDLERLTLRALRGLLPPGGFLPCAGVGARRAMRGCAARAVLAGIRFCGLWARSSGVRVIVVAWLTCVPRASACSLGSRAILRSAGARGVGMIWRARVHGRRLAGSGRTFVAMPRSAPTSCRRLPAVPLQPIRRSSPARSLRSPRTMTMAIVLHSRAAWAFRSIRPGTGCGLGVPALTICC